MQNLPFCWLFELDFAIGWRFIRFFFDDCFCLKQKMRISHYHISKAWAKEQGN